MLQLKNLELSCAKRRWFKPDVWEPILQNINLELNPGELVALVGGSGEGKSLLLQSILGLLPSTMKLSGQVFVDGRQIDKKQQKTLRGKTLGYIPQSVSALNPLIKVGRQVSRSAALSGKSPTYPELINQLHHYDLSEQILEQYPLSLSGGMAKRVLVSCATLSQARFILADEVTAWLDHQHAEVLLQHLQELCRQGRGVLWITHDLNLAASFADRVAVLHQGTIKEVIQSDKLRAGHGSPWLQSLWRSLPEHGFINHNVIDNGLFERNVTNNNLVSSRDALAYAANS